MIPKRLQLLCQFWLTLSLATVSYLVVRSLPTPASEKSSVEQIDRVLLAQAPIVPRDRPPVPPLPPPQLLPPPADLLQPPASSPTAPEESNGIPDKIRVKRFKFEGNTAISSEELGKVVEKFTKSPISFTELLQARTAITDLYLKKGYITSGAYIPTDQEFEDNGEVLIRIVEGSIAEINVTGTRRLNPGYIRSRLAIAAAKPLNQDRLRDALRLLQLNPLISSVNAELFASPRPGQSLLKVTVVEATTFDSQIVLNNGRSPSVGSFRRGIQLSEANLLGLGDGVSVAYTNTTGSNASDTNYTIPLSPHNITLTLSYGSTTSRIIESPFDVLNVRSKSRYYDLTLRQPLLQTPSQEIAIGLTASRRESETALSFDEINGGFPLSEGADAQGRTRVTALRFFQEWTQRSDRSVLAFRSQFSLGLNGLDASINPAPPDGRFFAWRGQGQWVRVLGSPDSLLLLRADLQFADRPLLSIEQFGIGGQESVRGYRQDTVLSDNGVFASAELRLPILRFPRAQGVVQLTPFVEVGRGWNRDRPDPNITLLASAGIGLRWQMGDRFTASIDWGVPLVSAPSERNTLQERGIYFSVLWNPLRF